MDNEELDFTDYLPAEGDDGNGEYDPAYGCSYCGFWQCAGDCDT